MAKKNYTKAGAQRACNAILGKLIKLQQDEYMSLDMFVKSTKMIQGIRDRIKGGV